MCSKIHGNMVLVGRICFGTGSDSIGLLRDVDTVRATLTDCTGDKRVFIVQTDIPSDFDRTQEIKQVRDLSP